MTAAAATHTVINAERNVCLDLIGTAKPGIIALELLLAGVCFFLAGGRDASIATLIWCLAGGAFTATSANCINCIWDRDIDLIMERTRRRALPSGRLSVETAWCFAFLSLAGGLAILWLKVNSLSALLALCAHIFYAVIYTVWLKRRYASNIVIGGVAGAMAPLIGWAGASGTLNSTALCLFLIVFLWTPPHFWALAINRANDYRLAQIPMLPVIRGAQSTGKQMLFYCCLLFPVTIALCRSDVRFSVASLYSLVFLDVVLLCSVLFQLCLTKPGSLDRQKTAARATFSISILHLAAFFCVVGFSI